MISKILDGKEISKDILKKINKRVEVLKNMGIVPRLDIILIGNNPASELYVSMKIKKSEDVGMKGELHRFPSDVDEKTVVRLIEKLNSDKNVNGILVQLPLPKHLNERKILDKILYEKDVDGLTTINMGNLFSGNALFEPCTPRGIMKILDSENVSVEGKNAVVIGRSNIVGKPIAMMLMKRNATVTVCHSKTKNLSEHLKNADIVIAAAGSPKLVTTKMIKSGAVVIDVGTNRTEDGLCGDVDFDNVKKKTSYITPVPGGVGPLTVAMVLENTLISAEKYQEKS